MLLFSTYSIESMRGADITQEELFSYRTLEERIPKKHPLRNLRKVVDLLLSTINDEFDVLYARRQKTVDATPPSISRARNAATTPTPRPPIPMLGCKKKSEGDKSQLAFLGHVLMENRRGLVVDVEVTRATGTAEREAAETMVKRTIHKPGSTLGADKNYDTKAVVRLKSAKRRNLTPFGVNITG